MQKKKTKSRKIKDSEGQNLQAAKNNFHSELKNRAEPGTTGLGGFDLPTQHPTHTLWDSEPTHIPGRRWSCPGIYHDCSIYPRKENGGQFSPHRLPAQLVAHRCSQGLGTAMESDTIQLFPETRY